jgi:hypothetical protein
VISTITECGNTDLKTRGGLCIYFCVIICSSFCCSYLHLNFALKVDTDSEFCVTKCGILKKQSVIKENINTPFEEFM